MVRICSVDRCKGEHDAKGFCKKHYARWHRYGNPLYVPDPEETRRKNSEGHRGKKPSFETRKKRSESMKKKKPNLNSLEALRKANIARIGTKLDENTKKKMSESLKKRYKDPDFKKRADITRQKMQSDPKVRAKIKINMKKLWENPEYKKLQSKSHKGQISPMKGKQHTEEAKEKNKIAHIGKKATKETKQKLIKFQNRPEVIQKSREDRAKQKIPSKNSKIELQTHEILTDAGIEFEKHIHVPIDEYKEHGLSPTKEVDILIKPNRIIEVNGYYHFDPRTHHANQKVRMRNETIIPKKVWDEEKLMLEQIRKSGYEILVVWDWDLKKDLEKTTKKILKFVKA